MNIRHLIIYAIMLVVILVEWIMDGITNGEMIIGSILVDIAYDVDCLLTESRGAKNKNEF